MISKFISYNEKSQLWRTEEKYDQVITGIAVVLGTRAGCCWKRQFLAGLEGKYNGFSTSVKRFQELAVDFF